VVHRTLLQCKRQVVVAYGGDHATRADTVVSGVRGAARAARHDGTVADVPMRRGTAQ
jgi:hypothetical protein